MTWPFENDTSTIEKKLTGAGVFLSFLPLPWPSALWEPFALSTPHSR